MKKCNLASIDSIESAGMLDGPGIRTIIFFNGCKLRCLYCHNPETWKMGKLNYTVDEVFEKIIKNKPYFRNKGGVTFSGGEPLLHSDFIVELSKKLKKEGVHIALDTAGVGNHNYDEILPLMDLIILDIKDIFSESYMSLTGYDIKESLYFIDKIKEYNKKIWIRQVIIPGINDNINYIKNLKEFLKNINNIEKIEFIPYHEYAKDKYKKLNIKYPLEHLKSMDIDKVENLYKIFMEK